MLTRKDKGLLGNTESSQCPSHESHCGLHRVRSCTSLCCPPRLSQFCSQSYLLKNHLFYFLGLAETVHLKIFHAVCLLFSKSSYVKVVYIPEFCCHSVAQSCLTLCDPMDCSTPGFPVLHYLPEFAQTHVYCISDAIQPSHPLSSPSPPAFNLSQHQSLSQWYSSSHQVAKVLEFQLQHQSFQWIFRTDFL